MNKALSLLILCVLFGITACSSANKEQTIGTAHEIPEMIEVTILIDSEPLPVNEPVFLRAEVTQGGEPVEDAKSVNFEFWHSEDEHHEVIEGRHSGGGLYVMETSFDRNGVYNVIAHVTARDMHNMPRKQFVVGEVSEEDKEKAKASLHHESTHMH